ncbi:hypothetical protein LOH54_07885 [Sulfurimonas sp. HSL-3221]|uniref:hypothetical protein n=1 Tax=Sulfurimonadaceae TaxID=2771471 RepID=UPI001E361D57|nr:hypothetical protein [Sulfurimonas sp. HSL-3221]UFS61582.1 hypothetical protein LOH54_07885 [Sulfurimonas sp. HSL-3221]
MLRRTPVTALKAAALPRRDETPDAPRLTVTHDGIHPVLARFIRQRLRVPESYAHIGTLAYAVGQNLGVMTTFSALNYRGESCTVHLSALIAPGGALLSVKQL